MLNTTPDKSMLDEGYARELINRMQKLRKKVKMRWYVAKLVISWLNIFSSRPLQCQDLTTPLFFISMRLKICTNPKCLTIFCTHPPYANFFQINVLRITMLYTSWYKLNFVTSFIMIHLYFQFHDIYWLNSPVVTKHLPVSHEKPYIYIHVIYISWLRVSLIFCCTWCNRSFVV